VVTRRDEDGVSARPTRAEQVRDRLLADLRGGQYLPGDKLPNEDELGRAFEVSRATVREAVQGLIEVGYLDRKHGLGTFVTGLPVHRHSIDMTVSYTAMIRGAGMVPAETVVGRAERAATADEAERLGIPAGRELLCIERVRTADGAPAVYSEDRIPLAALAGLVGTPMDASLYAILAEAGLTIHHAIATLRPVISDARLSRLLGVRRGSALQYIEQVDFTVNGTPAMLSSEWHVPGIFELSVHRRPIGGDLAD
jgi:GntR family transcriptional regulator